MGKSKADSLSLQRRAALRHMLGDEIPGTSDDQLWACLLLALHSYALLQMYFPSHEALKACFCPVCN